MACQLSSSGAEVGSPKFSISVVLTAGLSHYCSFPQCLLLPFSACSVALHMFSTD